MAFQELTEALGAAPIELPIQGKVYAFPGSISGRAWLLMQKMVGAVEASARAQAAGEDYDLDQEALPDYEYSELHAELLGGVDAEMIADGLGSAELDLVFRTLLIYHMSGRDMAETYWNARGEVQAPNRTQRRQAARGKPKTSPAGS